MLCKQSDVICHHNSHHCVCTSNHKEVLESGGILNLSKWMGVVSSKLSPLSCQGKSPWYHWIGGTMGPRASLDTALKEKFLSLLEIELSIPISRTLLTELTCRRGVTKTPFSVTSPKHFTRGG